MSNIKKLTMEDVPSFDFDTVKLRRTCSAFKQCDGPYECGSTRCWILYLKPSCVDIPLSTPENVEF